MGWILLAVVVVAVWFVVSLYNRLVGARNGYKNAFAQIDVQLKRRYDLIPNLVETAKGYMKHERETLEAVIKARNTGGERPEGRGRQPGRRRRDARRWPAPKAQLSGTLGRLFALAEAYPDLKANQNMMQLSEELTSTENKVAFARQAYNDAVMSYNNQREMFPGSIIAGMFNFTPAQLLEAREARGARSAEGQLHLTESADRPAWTSTPARSRAPHDALAACSAFLVAVVLRRRSRSMPSCSPSLVVPSSRGTFAAAVALIVLTDGRGAGHHLRRQPVQDRCSCARAAAWWRARWAARASSAAPRDLALRRLLNVVEEMAIASGVADARGLRARERGRHQRLRRRQLAGRRRHRRDARRGHAPQARRAAGRHRARVQPHPQRRHAAQPAVVRLDLRAAGHRHRRAASCCRHRRARGGRRTARRRGGADAGRAGRHGAGLHRRVLRAAHAGRGFAASRTAGGRLRRAVHAQSRSGSAGALLKIAGVSAGSQLVTPEAEEVAHMLFAPGMSRLFATHPSLEERLTSLDPRFRRSELPALAAAAARDARAATPADAASAPDHAPSRRARTPGGAVPAAALASEAARPSRRRPARSPTSRCVTRNAGAPGIPEPLREFVDSADHARALVLALLVSQGAGRAARASAASSNSAYGR